MGLFSSKSSKSYATTVNMASDLRQGVEGMSGGLVVGTKAVIGEPGSVTTSIGDYSTAELNFSGAKFKTGMTGTEVRDLLTAQASQQSAQLGLVRDFGQSALSAVTAAKTGEASDYTRYIPYAIIAAIALAALRRRSP